MVFNFNVGILGHIDSGKTTLARTLSQVASTAAFDKNPQSQERGITLDLGFSAMVLETPEHLKLETEHDKMQLTFVDCPGHASLIRTIIGGAQIVDLIILVVDVQKGIQTQTAECLVIGELTCKHIIVAINKVDMLSLTERSNVISKFITKLRKVMSTTSYGKDISMVAISAATGDNMDEFKRVLQSNLYIPTRNASDPFLFAVDHCFAIKGQGTVCTGTVIQGQIAVNDTVEITHHNEHKKVKSMQVFRQPVQKAQQGDRVGICFTQFDPVLLERGLLSQPRLLVQVKAAIMPFNCIKYYKAAIKSKSKFHMSVGHDTVMGQITLFGSHDINKFDLNKDYEYIEELDENTNWNFIYVLIEFESPVLTLPHSLVIASKLDMNLNSNACRIAFWGKLEWVTDSKTYQTDQLPIIKIFKRKCKTGSVQRVVNENEIIVQNLFKKESNRVIFVGLMVKLSTGEEGRIESTFGQTSKIKIRFLNAIPTSTIELLKKRDNNITVNLSYKKYIFNKNISLTQYINVIFIDTLHYYISYKKIAVTL